MKKQKKAKVAERLITDESITLARREGNGILRRQVWVGAAGKVTRYSLAYINHHIFQGDNGRVLGYDNAHGYHHKHYMGEIEPVHFNNFQETEEIFQQEFEVLHEQSKKKR